MKKIIAFLLTTVIVISLAACANEKTEGTPTESSTAAADVTTAPGTEPTEEETTTPSEPEETQAPTEPGEPEPGHTHSYETSVVEAQCTKDGYTLHKCACGDVYQTDSVKATGHQWGGWNTTKEPTTASKGESERKCTICGEKETKELDKLPPFHSHKYMGTVVKPTCTNKGYTSHVCSCGHSYTDSVTSAISHNFSKKVSTTAPTCTSKGYTTYQCTMCGKTEIRDYKDKIAHNYTSTVTAPTCTSGGYTTKKCRSCGGTEIVEKVSALGHNIKIKEVAPTCIEKGYTTKTCSRCDYTTTDYVNAKGHGSAYEDVKPATCSQNGYKRVRCRDCDAVIREETLPADGGAHNWGKRVLSEQVKYEYSIGIIDHARYNGFTDHVVAYCKNCGEADYSQISQRYSAYEAANIALGYVNDLREEVFGTDEYNLQLDSVLIEWANARAYGLVFDFSHNGIPDGCKENITTEGDTIYGNFNAWLNSPGHYAQMVFQKHRYFGYGMYTDSNGGVYAVQLFK